MQALTFYNKAHQLEAAAMRQSWGHRLLLPLLDASNQQKKAYALLFSSPSTTLFFPDAAFCSGDGDEPCNYPWGPGGMQCYAPDYDHNNPTQNEWCVPYNPNSLPAHTTLVGDWGQLVWQDVIAPQSPTRRYSHSVNLQHLERHPDLANQPAEQLVNEVTLDYLGVHQGTGQHFYEEQTTYQDPTMGREWHSYVYWAIAP
mgnify:CR=1 FL=1|tara:strand:- start:949 stop:1548 length:600 start_codon:yes stop_codon:yes gene_type:complete